MHEKNEKKAFGTGIGSTTKNLNYVVVDYIKRDLLSREGWCQVFNQVLTAADLLPDF